MPYAHITRLVPFILVVLCTQWLVAPACAVEPEKFFYLGEVKLSSASGQSIGSQAILFEKVHDPDKSAMIESAVVVHPDGKVEQHTMRVTVKDNTFTLRDDAMTIEGSGTLAGPAWKWTYFKATYKSKTGVQIEDENFMSDSSVITARKRVTGPDGKVVMYMDMSLKAITAATFDILKTGLLKKSS